MYARMALKRRSLSVLRIIGTIYVTCVVMTVIDIAIWKV